MNAILYYDIEYYMYYLLSKWRCLSISPFHSLSLSLRSRKHNQNNARLLQHTHTFQSLKIESNRRIANTESYKLSNLYPDTLYYIWLAARSQRGEGATTPPITVRTKQYGKDADINSYISFRLFPLSLSLKLLLKHTRISPQCRQL